MSEKIQTYQYPVQYRTIAVLAPLTIIFASIALGYTAFQNLRAADWVNDAGQVVNPAVFWGAVILAFFLATFFAICIHLTYPTINAKADGFQLVTRIYTSPWFTWDDIYKIGLPPSNLVTQIYSVGVRGLHPVFWAIGLTRGMLAPGFLIHPRMIDGGKLLKVMIKKRPELFEE